MQAPADVTYLKNMMSREYNKYSKFSLHFPIFFAFKWLYIDYSYQDLKWFHYSAFEVNVVCLYLGFLFSLSRNSGNLASQKLLLCINY